MSIFYWIVWILAYLPIRIFYPTIVSNKKIFHKKGRAILACNHMSNMDIIVLKAHQHRKSYVLAKHTLFKNKFFGACLKGLGSIPVNRQEVGTSTIKTTLKVLKEENQLVIFPEGARKTSIEEAESLKNGMAMFALKTNSPIIPMVFVKKPKFLRFNKILVGEPIDLSKYKDVKPTKEIYNEISSQVLKEMQKLREDYLNSKNSKKRKIKQNNA